MVVGTPYFMSPEQCEAKPVDQRGDIYSLGATYYCLLTGKSPYHDSESVPQLMYAHCHRPTPDPRSTHATVPEASARIIAFAMAKAPADRYQSVSAMLADLQAVAAALSGQTPIALPSATSIGPAHAAATQIAPVTSSRRRLPIVAAGVSILALLALAALLWRPWNKAPDDPPGPEPIVPPTRVVLTATAPGVTATDITLGMSAPFSGPAKELGRGMKTGIETYFDHVNKAGGIHGRSLKLLPLDDGYDPKLCAEKMKEMLERPVFAFIGNVGTPTAEVSVPLVLQHKRVLFGAFTGANLLRRSPPDRYVFNYRASYAEETAAMVHYLLTVPKRKVLPEQIAVFAQEDGYGDAGFEGVRKVLGKLDFDTDRILRVGYKRNTLDVEAAVRELLDHKDRVKAVVMVCTYGPGVAFIKGVRDGGMNPIFTNVSFVDSEALAEGLRETAPQYAQGVVVTQVVPFYGSSSTAVLRYRDHLAQFAPSERPGFVSLEGYVAAQLLCKGLEKAGPEVTTEKLVEALESIQNLDVSLGMPITYGPSEHQGSHKVWATILDANGQFQNLELD
jgi:ABC-type branched-subunit amino acid transport system substrate-binding protein